MANKYVTANNKLVVVDGKLLQVSGDGIDDELLNLIDTQTTSLGTTELSVSELDTLIDNHIVDGVTLINNSTLMIENPSNNSVEIKDIRVSNIDVAFMTLNTTNSYIDLYGSGNDVTLYQDTTLTYESGNITTDNLTAENIKKDVEILGVIGTHEGGASLNLAYGQTPPSDTSKIWLQCEEPQAVEVQNYLGEASVGNVANYGVISNPVDGNSYFYSSYYSSCYIGENKIAIVGYDHIRIYDLTSKSYTADYTISVGTSAYYYSNVLFKDNIIYFSYDTKLYSYDLSTQTLTNIIDISYRIRYILFHTDNEIDLLCYHNSSSQSYRYRYNINTATKTTIKVVSGSYFDYCRNHTIKANNTVYNFYMYTTTSNNYYTWKYNLSSDSFTKFTSFYDFMTELGWTAYRYSSVIYDGERYIYLTGGETNNSKSDLIIKYDTVNDSFEVLDQKLISAKYYHYSVLVDNRVYMFGGYTWTSNNVTYGRPNQIDYFDISYPLTENNAIITTNTINTDNALPLINTDKLKINSNIASAYKGNADNLAEKVNAYYHNGYGWIGINCEDFAYYFVWSTITNETISSALVIDLSTYYTTNAKDVVLSVSSTNATAFEVTLSGTELTITPLEVSQTTIITVTATVNAVEYQTTFTVTSADIIASA
jgi:hypothetical protein